MDFAYTLAGFFVGAVVGLTGVGGGSLMTPILVLGFGVQPALAVGTDLLYAACTKAGGIWVHQRHGTIDWRVCGHLAAGSVPAAGVTLAVLHALGSRGVAYDDLITTTLGIALVLTALAILFKSRIAAYAARVEPGPWLRYRGALTVACGGVLGVLVTLSSVGAGALGAAMLFYLYPRMRSVNIVGTDIAHAVPLTAVAGLGHLSLGSVDFAMLGSLLLGSLPGIWLGSRYSARLPEHLLRPALASMLLFVGAKMAI